MIHRRSATRTGPNLVVNAVIFDDRGQVLLTKRRDNNLWCLPGGLVETGETITRAIEREVLEEIHLRVTVKRLTGVYSMPNVKLVSPATAPTVVLAFECAVESGVPTTSDEVSEVAYHDPAALPSPMIETHARRIAHARRRGFEAVIE